MSSLNVQILKTDVVMDVGKSLNPAVDIGQIEGAFMQVNKIYPGGPKGPVLMCNRCRLNVHRLQLFLLLEQEIYDA